MIYPMPRPLAVFFSAMLLVFLCCTSRSDADEIVLNNGDRLTGSVVSASEGKLTFNTS